MQADQEERPGPAGGWCGAVRCAWCGAPVAAADQVNTGLFVGGKWTVTTYHPACLRHSRANTISIERKVADG